jgi:hypothetical protein
LVQVVVGAKVAARFPGQEPRGNSRVYSNVPLFG